MGVFDPRPRPSIQNRLKVVVIDKKMVAMWLCGWWCACVIQGYFVFMF